MEDQKGIWVYKSIMSPYGELVVGVRLDTAIDPQIMLDKLDKEKDNLDKKMDKILAKLDKLNDKTPQKITDATIKELVDIHNLQTRAMTEWWRWEEVLWQQEIEKYNDKTTDSKSE